MILVLIVMYVPIKVTSTLITNLIKHLILQKSEPREPKWVYCEAATVTYPSGTLDTSTDSLTFCGWWDSVDMEEIDLAANNMSKT